MRVGIVGIVIAVALGAGAASTTAAMPGYEQHPLDLSGRHLFDLAVADVDGDLDQDLFTVNHLSRGSVLLNGGAPTFGDALYPLGLAHTRAFPGWEEEAPRPDGPGLYLSHKRSAHYVRHLGPGRVSGRAIFLLDARASTRGNASARVIGSANETRGRRISFTLRGNSRVRLDPERTAAPVRLRIDRPFPLDDVRVGASPEVPAKRQFTLYLRDRHGIAWADLGGDADPDAYIVRGGLQGQIDQLRGRIHDELLIARPKGLRPAADGRRPRKGTCRGRAAGAVDFSNDGRLDLYSTCKGGGPRLHRRSGKAFERVRNGALDAEVLRWADLDGDLRPEALGAGEGWFATYERRRGDVVRTRRLAGRHSGVTGLGLAMADHDRDGDLDAYAASGSGSTLLRNSGGRLRATDPADRGLPRKALAASWADADGDGDQDLLTVPGGLFIQGEDGGFAPTGAPEGVADAEEARIAWADLDGNGARDPVIATRAEGARSWEAQLLLAPAPSEGWLAVRLRGAEGNREAIGARVRVRAGGEVQTQWVGQNEASLYSQGHYLAYFALGEEASAQVSVRWPDGERLVQGGIAADQTVEIVR